MITESSIQYAGWIFAGGMAIINLIIGYLVIPTRGRIDRLEGEFHKCQHRSAGDTATLAGAKEYHLALINKSESKIVELTGCMGQVKVSLARIETEQKSVKEMAEVTSGKVDLILSELRKR